MSYDVARVRAAFPSLDSGIAHFDGPGGSQVPASVGAAVAATLTSSLTNRGANNPSSRRADDVVAAARSAVGDLLGTEASGVVFGRSMTQLCFDLARTLSQGWSAGDEVVVTRLDHDANVRPWVAAAERVGAVVRWADFDSDTGELRAEHVQAVLSERTRVLAVTGASNLVGSCPDLPALAALAHDVGALLVVDGVHLTPHRPVDRLALGADVYLCSPYKFLGPHCGVLAADSALLETLHPDKPLPASDAVPERFEVGTLPYELLAGTTAAIDFLADLVPSDDGANRRERVLHAMHALAAHEESMARLIRVGLDEVPGLQRHGRPASATPTMLYTLPGHDMSALSDALGDRGVNAPSGSFYAPHTARHLGLDDTGGLRVGVAPYTDASDVARLVDGLAGLVQDGVGVRR